MSKAKAGWLACIAAIGGVGFFAMQHKSLAGPSTCREFAEHLQARGMDIRWVPSHFKHPAICIVRSSDCKGLTTLPGAGGGGGAPDESDSNLEKVLNNSYDFWNHPKVIVVQYPSAREARDEAGITKTGFAWDRFVIFGDAEMVKEIKNRL